MAYFIPTNDPDFTLPERYRERERKHYRPMQPRQIGEPKFKKGDLVMLNFGIYRINEVRERKAKNGKGKGDYTYDVGSHSPVAENSLAPVSDEILQRFGLRKQLTTDNDEDND